MRKVIYRGKKIGTDEWIYGYLWEHSIKGRKHFVIGSTRASSLDCFEVDPDTVGQHTGFIAKNKKANLDAAIYEDDVFRHTKVKGSKDIVSYLVVMWIWQRACFYMIDRDHYYAFRDNDLSQDKDYEWLFQEADLYDFSIDCNLPKVGNIHDNPELLND